MLVNKHVLIIYPSDLFSGEFSSGISTINLHLGSGAGPWATQVCILKDTSHICWCHLPKQSPRKKQRMQKLDSTSSRSYCTTLVYLHRNQGYQRYTCKPALREVVARLACWNKEETPKRKQVDWTLIWIPALREVDYKPNAKRGTNMAKTLASLYWLTQSLHLKQSLNQSSHKSTKLDPVRQPQIWKKSDQIPKSYPL